MSSYHQPMRRMFACINALLGRFVDEDVSGGNWQCCVLFVKSETQARVCDEGDNNLFQVRKGPRLGSTSPFWWDHMCI